MTGTLLAFLRWYFGLQRVDVDDLTIELTNAGLTEVPVADLQEGLALLRDEVDADTEVLVRQAQEMIEAASLATMSETGASLYELSIDDVAAPPASPEPAALTDLPGVTIVTEAESGEPRDVDSVPPAASEASPESTPPPSDSADAPVGAAPPPTPPPAPGYSPPPPPSYHEPPPHEPPPEDPPSHQPEAPEPPPEDRADEPAPPPETWAGLDVVREGDALLVTIDGVVLELESDGEGGYVATHSEYVLGEGPAGIVWTNTPSGAPYEIDELTDEGILIALAENTSVELAPEFIRYRFENSTLLLGEPWEFVEVLGTGIAARHPDFSWELVQIDDGSDFRDPATGEIYDTIQDYEAAQAEEAPPLPDTWAGHTVQVDDNGDAYVRVDDERLDLEPDGEGGFAARYLGYDVTESPGGELVWTNTPTGAVYEIRQLRIDGISINHPSGDYVHLHENGTATLVDADSDGIVENLTIGTPFTFYELLPDGLVASHPDGFEVIYDEQAVRYRDPETGTLYDSIAELQAAQQPDDDSGADAGEAGDVIDAIPATFGGFEIETDQSGAFVIVDGYRVDLVEVSPGEYAGSHGGHELASVGADIVWTDTPTGEYYRVESLLPEGVVIDHPDNGDTIEFHGTVVRYENIERSAGETGALVLDADRYPFHSLHPDGIRFTDANGYVLQWDASSGRIGYYDPATGTLYDTEADYLDAIGDGQGAAEEPDPVMDGELDEAPALGAEPVSEGTLDPVPPPPPDAISIDYAGGGPILAITVDGVAHSVSLSTVDGGLFATIGGQPYEVHSHGGTYIVVANGQAYDLQGDPSAPGWPFDNPEPGVDVAAYEPPPPPPPDPPSDPADEGVDELFRIDNAGGPDAAVDPATMSQPDPDAAVLDGSLPPEDPAAGDPAIEPEPEDLPEI